MSKDTTYAIEVVNLVKKYGHVTAVQDISFRVEAGSIFAFLGTNGAGKSTTIGCLTTLRSITSGQVTVAGYSIGASNEQIQRAIGVVFQSSLLDPLLTVKENLQSRARFYGLGRADTRISELSKLIDLGAILNTRYGTLSGGQKRHVDIARALIHTPSILFLDEPTAGLDPESREKVWRTINRLRKDTGLTVFLTTHYMEETERADMAYVIHAGSVVAHGTPSSLRERFSKDQLRLIAVDTDKLSALLSSLGQEFVRKNDEFVISVDGSKAALALLERSKALMKDFEFRHGSMDDVFLELTAQNAEGDAR